MSHYRHTQTGTVLLFGLLGALVGALVIATLRSHPVTLVMAALMAVLTMLFHSLTVEVGHDVVTIRFGIGWIRKRIPLAKIQSARAVRNRWYYGWGIRMTPHGWLWNVSGLDAVELSLSGGKRFRVGTDEPRRLLQALALTGKVQVEA